MSIAQNLHSIKVSLPKEVTLVAVSKTKSVETILEAYQAGQTIFGENKVQEMVEKYEQLPNDIEWHMIGHLQSNKVKYMASFVSLIHGVDSFKLLKEIDKQAQKHERVINCLLQIKIASEDSKFGMGFSEAQSILTSESLKKLQHVNIIGVMGMATFTTDQEIVTSEFNYLKGAFEQLKEIQPDLSVVSMGMSDDYSLAIACGSTMVRIGSRIFGARNY